MVGFDIGFTISSRIHGSSEGRIAQATKVGWYTGKKGPDARGREDRMRLGYWERVGAEECDWSTRDVWEPRNATGVVGTCGSQGMQKAKEGRGRKREVGEREESGFKERPSATRDLWGLRYSEFVVEIRVQRLGEGTKVWRAGEGEGMAGNRVEQEERPA